MEAQWVCKAQKVCTDQFGLESRKNVPAQKTFRVHTVKKNTNVDLGFDVGEVADGQWRTQHMCTGTMHLWFALKMVHS